MTPLAFPPTFGETVCHEERDLSQELGKPLSNMKRAGRQRVRERETEIERAPASIRHDVMLLGCSANASKTVAEKEAFTCAQPTIGFVASVA